MSRRNSSPTTGQMGFWTDVVEPPPLYIPPTPPLPLTEEPATQGRAVGEAQVAGLFVSEDLTVKGTKGKIRTNLEIIKALYKIEEEKRLPSPEEMALLARYSAFGGLAKVFDPSPKNPEISLFKEVKDTLNPLDYKAAKASVVNAFYTDPAIIQAMWAYLERLGFSGGRVLEPAAATGLFFAGMPPALRAASELTAVELDRLSGRLGLYLHPDVTYHLKGLEETTFQPGYFDLVISNAPFGDYGVFDNSLTDAERALCKSAIHDYYFIKAAQLVRRGGLVAMITSRFTLDKKEDAVRRYLAERFDLVGTVRLPSATFSAFAGTDVITDILFLQRKAEDGLSRDPIWLDAGLVELKGPRGPEEFRINDYYTHAHPHAVLGQLTCRTGPYGAKLLVDGDIDPTTLTDRILAALPDCASPLCTPVQAKEQTARFTVDASLDKVREGSYGYQIVGGVRTVYQKVRGLAVPVNKDKTTLDRLVALVDLVALARNVLDQCLYGSDAALAESQAQLGDAYDHFVRKYGYLNTKYNRQLFADDPNAPFLRALERWNEEQQTATKTKVFSERTIRTLTAPTGAASAVDALAICLNQKGHIDLDYMATLYGKPKVEIVAELGDALFHDPVLDQWQTRAEYLSGNVLQKLEAAQAQANPLYERNAAALKAVLPLPLLAEEITVSLGNTWVPVDVVSQFLKELYNPLSRVNHMDEPNYHPSSYHWSFANVTSQVTYVPALGRWVVERKGKVFNTLTDEKWGTNRRNLFVLLEAALNGSEVKVFDTGKDNRQVLNATETIAAREKVNLLHKAFRQWVWLDPKRKQMLTDLYNRTFRGMVRPTYDGSYLTLPGTSLDLPPLRQNQTNGIARILQGENTLLWHAVGSGKSRIMIISSMELKRLGLRNRPVHVVPNPLLEQYATEFYRVYPHARLLIVNSKSMSPQRKQETLARIATEEWDAILINASAFQRIPLNLETWEWLLMDQIAELEQAIEEREDDEDQRLTVKQLRGKLNRAEYRLRERRGQANQDKGGLTFEQMGIDALFVDECFPWETLVMTDRGPLPIGYIVDNRLPVKVLSRNLQTGQLEWKPITRWLPRPSNKQLVRVVHERGSFICTEDHKIWTEQQGYVKAKDLTTEKTLCVLRGEDRSAGPVQVLPGRMQRGVLGGGKGQAIRDGALPHLQTDLSKEHGESDLLQRGVPIGGVRVHRFDLLPLRQDVSGATGASRREVPGPIQHLLLRRLPESGQKGKRQAGDKDVRTVRGKVFIPIFRGKEQRQTQVLYAPLCDALATRPSHGAGVWGQSGTQDAYVAGATQSQFRPDEEKQPIQAARSGGQDERGHEGQNVSKPWGQLADYHPTTNAGGSAAPGGIYGVCDPNEAGQGSVRVFAELLQGGHCGPEAQAGDRSGWHDPQDGQMEVSGPTQDRRIERARVVRVEVLEPGDHERSGGVCGEGQKVYDIEVADNHNFFANGVLVSNCHQYRNLYFMTERGHLPGIGGDESGLAFDLFVKSQFVTRRCTKGHILGSQADCSCGAARAQRGQLVGATGTAITNSISEMFTLQRFFQMDLLIQKGLENFDAWASTFGETETVIEMNPSGKGWRTKERFVNFINVPELLDLFKQVADIWINPDTLGLERPTLATGAPIPIELDPIDELLDVMEHCARRADDLKHNRFDNMLAIMGTATRAATDVRLVGKAVDHPRSKANRLVEEVFRIWQETASVQLPGLDQPVGLTQLVFLDIGVPGGDAFDLYNDLRAKWVALGVPPEQIAFATDYETDAQRKALYDAVNAGIIRILMATTGRAGMGVNIQRLLVALHHVDITWTPASVEQREGRIMRPGNLNPLVWIYRYIVKKSLDFHKWHLLELKAKANRQLFMTDTTTRTVQDLDQAVLSFSQMKAIATGDPLLMEKVKLETDLNRLYALYDKYMLDRRSLDREMRDLEMSIPGSRKRAAEYQQAYIAFSRWEEKPPVKVQGRVYKKRSDAGAHLQQLINLKLVEPDVVDLGYAKVSLVPALDGVWLEINCPPIKYTISPGDAETGHLLKVDNFLKKMEGDAQFYERQANSYAERLAFLAGQEQRGFAYQAELDAAQARWDAIDAELNRRADHAVEVQTLAEGLETTE